MADDTLPDPASRPGGARRRTASLRRSTADVPEHPTTSTGRRRRRPKPGRARSARASSASTGLIASAWSSPSSRARRAASAGTSTTSSAHPAVRRRHHRTSRGKNGSSERTSRSNILLLGADNGDTDPVRRRRPEGRHLDAVRAPQRHHHDRPHPGRPEVRADSSRSPATPGSTSPATRRQRPRRRSTPRSRTAARAWPSDRASSSPASTSTTSRSSTGPASRTSRPPSAASGSTSPRRSTTTRSGSPGRRAGRRFEGQEALAYVRTRHGLDNGDFDRIERQQNFLRATMQKLLLVVAQPVTLRRSSATWPAPHDRRHVGQPRHRQPRPLDAPGPHRRRAVPDRAARRVRHELRRPELRETRTQAEPATVRRSCGRQPPGLPDEIPRRRPVRHKSIE